MTNLHIINTKDFGEFGVEFEVELNRIHYWIDADTILKLIADGTATTVTYNEENEEAISEEIKLDYAEVATEEDGYDVYVHYFNMYDGEITRKSVSGSFIKTYKTLKGAKNKAKELSSFVK